MREEAHEPHRGARRRHRRMGSPRRDVDYVASAHRPPNPVDPHPAFTGDHIHNLLRERMAVRRAGGGSFKFDDPNARIGTDSRQGIGRPPAGQVGEGEIACRYDRHDRSARNAKMLRT